VAPSPWNISLNSEEQFVLDLVVEEQFASAEPTKIDQVLLARPVDQARALRAAVDSVEAKGCLVQQGYANEYLHLTPRGLLVSKRGADVAALAEALLEYMKRRLASPEGGRFKAYTWNELRDAGVVSLDDEYPVAVTVIHVLDMYKGKAGAAPESTAWYVPQDVVDMRALKDIRDIVARAERRAVERKAPTGGVDAGVTLIGATTNPGSGATTMPDPDKKKVFIIHGRNAKARDQMGIFLRSLGLVPINFADLRASMGGTPTVAEIVEKGMADAQGVVALFTPDEYAAVRPDYRYPHDRDEDVARWQARPNVIFEAGIAFGRDRKRVVFVLFGDPRLFTDVAGIHILRPTNDPRGDRATLRNTLAQGMECAVEPHSTDWMTSGDFDMCADPLSGVSARDPFRP
jgi:predicted nucleotide-binding protein